MRRRRNPELPLPPEVLVLVDALDELGLVSPEFIQCMLVYNEEERLATVDRWMSWLQESQEPIKFVVVWDNGSDTGTLTEEFDTYEDAAQFGQSWVSEMRDELARDYTRQGLDIDSPEISEELENAYSWDVAEKKEKKEEGLDRSKLRRWLPRNQGTWDDARDLVREKTKFSGLSKFSTRVCSILYDWWMEGSDEDFFFGEGQGSAGAFTSNLFLRTPGPLRYERDEFPFFFNWYHVSDPSLSTVIPPESWVLGEYPQYLSGNLPALESDPRRTMNWEDWESILGIKAFIIEEHDSGAVYCEGYESLVGGEAFGQALEVLRARQGEGEDEEPEPEQGPDIDTPQEDDLFTSNYRTFFSSGRCVLTVDENGPWQARVREYMRRENFYPNVWLSDPRGGNTLLDAYPIERELDQIVIKNALRDRRLFIMQLGPNGVSWTGAKLSSYRDAQARTEQVGMGEDMFIVIIDEPWLNESAARQREEAGDITALAAARRVELGIITQTGPAVGVVAVRRNDG